MLTCTTVLQIRMNQITTYSVCVLIVEHNYVSVRCTPVECLHTLLLGPVKYFLQELMDRLSPREKDDVAAKICSFNFSGFEERLSGNAICRYGENNTG